MNLVTPDIGLLFWMLVSFSLILFLLKKYAWKPILEIAERTRRFHFGCIECRKKAKEEMANLKSDNEQILAEARNERDVILKEAREAKDSIINDAKTKATEEADRLIKIAREGIQNEKMAAITELKKPGCYSFVGDCRKDFERGTCYR